MYNLIHPNHVILITSDNYKTAREVLGENAGVFPMITRNGFNFHPDSVHEFNLVPDRMVGEGGIFWRNLKKACTKKEAEGLVTITDTDRLYTVSLAATDAAYAKLPEFLELQKSIQRMHEKTSERFTQSDLPNPFFIETDLANTTISIHISPNKLDGFMACIYANDLHRFLPEALAIKRTHDLSAQNIIVAADGFHPQMPVNLALSKYLVDRGATGISVGPHRPNILTQHFAEQAAFAEHMKTILKQKLGLT